MTRQLLTDVEAAKCISMSVSYLRQSRSRGAIGNETPAPPFIKIGKSVRYRPEDLEEFVLKNRRHCPGAKNEGENYE